jgi:ATP-dependent Clp protease ATP-binding subunit ClpA
MEKPKVSQQLAKVSQELAEISQIKCKYCGQSYKHKSSLSKHIKYSCTKNKDEDLKELVRLLNMQLEEQKQEFTKKIDSQSKQIEKLMGKLEINGSFNKTINNFNLLAYRETDTSHLTDQDYRFCIKKVNYCVKNMIEKVHFNPVKPENMNIYISNIKDKYIMVYDGHNWNLANKKDELDRLYEEKEMMLEEWLETNPEKELKDKFLKYLNNKENDECLNRIKDEIKLMLYNKKMLELN